MKDEILSNEQQIRAGIPASATRRRRGMAGCRSLTVTTNVTVYPLLSSVSSTNLYIWGLDLSGTPQGAGGVGGLLAVIDDNANTYMPAYDANGNVTEYVDSSGNAVAHYAYDAYGNTIAQSGPMAPNMTQRFSTKYYDGEYLGTDMYRYEQRIYAPRLHRWLSTDPIGERGGLNLYGFCGNDPINKWDYLGMAYFAKRRLETSWWWNIPAVILFWEPKYNYLNIEGSHEQLFFEDGKKPSNLGFFARDDRRKLPEGVRSDTEELLKGYWKTGDSGYNDCVMRKAVDYTHTQPYSLLGRGYALGSLFDPGPAFWAFLCSEGDPIKFNCQDWASAVRKNYRKFYRDPKVRKECCIKSTFLPEGRDFIIWDTY